MTAIWVTCIIWFMRLLTHALIIQGHWEAPPYQGGSMRSAYHIRQLEVYRLLQIQQPIDVFISHDWPRGIARHGAMQQLFKAKPFLQTEVRLQLCVMADCTCAGDVTDQSTHGRDIRPSRFWYRIYRSKAG